MKRTLVIIGITFLVIVAAAFAYFFMTREEQDIAPEPDGVTFPLVGRGDTTGRGTMQLRTWSGDTLEVRNFLAASTTAEDPSNEGNYYVAGDIDYCPECSTSDITDFTIIYFSQDQAFGISLNREPLGEVRRRAERYLQEALGLTEAEMCGLSYSLGTTVSVNQTYGSKGNLGFSFCPGAIPLP